VGVSLAAPSSAAALDPEVNYDPGSLSGKEYVIPLAGGRSDGAGTTDQVRGGAVAFGIGMWAYEQGFLNIERLSRLMGLPF
jgi:hypothetical protein